MRKPKPIRLTLEPPPRPTPGRAYAGLVKDVSLKKQSIVVTVESLDKEMAGCLYQADLPKCLQLGNKTNRFASAAGLDVDKVGESIDLRAAIGVTVVMRFILTGNNYEIEFEKAKAPAQAEPGRDETLAGDTGWDHQAK